MTLDDAIFADVHEFPGGTEKLAPIVGVTVQVLRNMANPLDQGHGWSLARFRKLLCASDGKKSLLALCEENGGVFLPMAPVTGKVDTALLRALHRMSSEFSDVPRAIERAVRGDGRISANEMRDIAGQCSELIQAVLLTEGMARMIYESRQRVDEDDRP